MAAVAPPTKNRRLKAPRERVSDEAEGYFYPNEVVRILSLQRLDYRQLRRLFHLVAASRGAVQPRKWARYTFQDIAALRAAIEALGGVEAVSNAKRLPLRKLERVCYTLRQHYGLKNPLTEAKLAWDGREVSVQLRGARFQPDSGQLLLNLSDRIHAHLRYAAATENERQALRPLVRAETQVIRHQSRSLVRVPTSTAPVPYLRFGKG